jgi:hypothetical protein
MGGELPGAPGGMARQSAAVQKPINRVMKLCYRRLLYRLT